MTRREWCEQNERWQVHRFARGEWMAFKAKDYQIIGGWECFDNQSEAFEFAMAQARAER